jgi:phage tail-like protein
LKVVPDRRNRWRSALPQTGVVAANDRGFCIEESGPDGAMARRCFTRDGEAARFEDVSPSPPPRDERVATLETSWLDSGIPRCRWHRVVVDADCPPDTAVKVFVAVKDGLPTDPPNPEDWEELATLDALIQKQPAGRSMRVRVTLRGTAFTPLVRRVRLEFPRSSSLDRLPPVYRDNPIAEDFTERFLALFDAALADTDRAVAEFARLLNVESGPEETLPWLGRLFGVQLDPSWTAARRRAVLMALPRLYARRGTRAGMAEAIRLLFDIEPAILDRAGARPWGAVGSVKLGGVRLFGKSAARFRLGHSALGRAGLISFGNPDLDPFRNVAHRFSVLTPPLSMRSADEAARLERLIDSQKPAHTRHQLRIGGAGFVVGLQSTVGVDSLLALVPPFVLGSCLAPQKPGAARLNRHFALYPGRRGRRGFEIGQALVGKSTVLE